MKGIGCYVWDTPEIIRAKKANDLQSDVSNNSRKAELNGETEQKETNYIFFSS